MGIVFVFIVGLWAVVLVPMWIRSHDAATESKSVDRFSTAMRTLSRRTSETGSRDLVMPGRSRAAVLSGGRAPSAAARRVRAAELAQMRRRRTVACLLLGFLAVVLIAAVLGAAPIWLPLVVFVGTGAYAWNLRAQALQAAKLERRRRNPRRAATAGPARAEVRQAPIWPVAAVVADAHVPAPVVVDPQVVPAAATGETLAEGEWAPTRVVLPTYVTAPPATSVPRVIDLTHPGSWSAAHMLDQLAAQNAPDPDEIFDGRALLDDGHDRLDIESEQQAVAQTVAGSTAQPFLDDDVVFDQNDDDEFLAFLDRRASGA